MASWANHSPLISGGHCSEQCLLGEHEAREVGVRVQECDALHLCFAKPVELSRQTVVEERPRDLTCYMIWCDMIWYVMV